MGVGGGAPQPSTDPDNRAPSDRISDNHEQCEQPVEIEHHADQSERCDEVAGHGGHGARQRIAHQIHIIGKPRYQLACGIQVVGPQIGACQMGKHRFLDRIYDTQGDGLTEHALAVGGQALEEGHKNNRKRHHPDDVAVLGLDHGHRGFDQFWVGSGRRGHDQHQGSSRNDPGEVLAHPVAPKPPHQIAGCFLGRIL